MEIWLGIVSLNDITCGCFPHSTNCTDNGGYDSGFLSIKSNLIVAH
jgi:hypothetical protein